MKTKLYRFLTYLNVVLCSTLMVNLVAKNLDWAKDFFGHMETWMITVNLWKHSVSIEYISPILYFSINLLWLALFVYWLKDSFVALKEMWIADECEPVEAS